MDPRDELIQRDDLDQDDSTIDLVTGLVNDTRELLGAHVSAARLEIKDELRELARSVKKAVAGAVIGGVGAILLGFAISFVLVALGLPVWAAHGIVALVAIGAAVALGLMARTKADGVPEREIARTVHDARWIAKRARAAAREDGTGQPH
jgi:hypothetical protein